MESADALIEEKKLMNEAKYRNYMTNIDKALRNFEYSSEWADLISALGKLSKAISSNTQYQIIPRRIKISKRLAQCMHPALPSGVHLKALETYDVIFSKTGPERLATELFIYSAGLFPLLGYAAMNARPALLGVYEKYFVPLGEKLRPALSGFLSGVLPGYESGLDHFDRTNSLLTQVCSAVSPMYFYTVLWECVATNASIRLPAITYILEHFNKRLGMQEQVYIMGHNRDVMMSGLCACLNDSLILVQRNTLEFLLLGFPMHTDYLNQNDLIKLVTNGLNTILRRDMSLNRRLYSWLLGSEVTKTTQYEIELNADGSQDSYFDKHSKKILINAIICLLKFSLESNPVDLKPYRIMVSLLDKSEIGPPILDYVLCDIIRTMSLSSGNLEVGKSANLLFATFDPAYIWNFMTIMYEKSCKQTQETSKLSRNLRKIFQSKDEKFECVVGSGDPCLIEICFLTEFLLETISLEMYNETTRVYLPKVFLAITQMLTIHSENLSNDEIYASLKLCLKIVSRVQPMITSPIRLISLSKRTFNDDNNKISKNSVNDHSNFSSNTLEKSKSDSKLNQFAMPYDLEDNNNIHEEPIRRSNSNHNMARQRSPKKTKKAKSYSKLSELDKEICPDTGQLIMPSSSSDLDTPLSIKKLKNKKISPKLKTSPKKHRPKDLKVDGPKSLDPSILHSKTNAAKSENKQNTTEHSNKMDQQELLSQTRETTSQEYSVLEKCIRQYEVFFEVFLSRKLLQIEGVKSWNTCTVTVQVQSETTNNSPRDQTIFENDEVFEEGCENREFYINKIFDSLKINIICRSTQLQSLLNRSLINTMGSTSDLSDTDFKDCLSSNERLDKVDAVRQQQQQTLPFDEQTEKNITKLMETHLSDSLRNAIKIASNLLIEMSTFPNCISNLVLDRNESELPRWLKVLTLVASYTQNDKELQLTAITTLFDLISLLKSQTEHTTSPGVNFVVMLPLLKFGHVTYIENKTRIFQLITSILWNYLGEPSIDPAQISSLLYQLHNCLDSGLVETVIGNRMSSAHKQFANNQLMNNVNRIENSTFMKTLNTYKIDRLADIKMMCVSPIQGSDSCEQLTGSESQSFKKFELLWHLGRDKQPSKSFEKTLLRVLDTLGLPYYISLRTFVTKWLQESLLRGDLSRLIKPLNKILLSPNTKRIGIVHIHLIKANQDESQSESNSKDIDEDRQIFADRGVYAISSEDGNVKFHTALTHNKKRSPIRSLQKKLFGVTLGNKNKTSNFVSEKTTISLTESESNIGLIINPLDNSSDYEGIESEELTSLSSSAPNKMENSQKSNDGSEKDEEKNETEKRRYSSSDDESGSSSFDTESENREISVEKESSSSFGNVKRFVGDCERVTEILSEHDRTKNRKTYHLTRTGSDIIEKLHNAMSTVTDGQLILDDTAHTAEDYFSSSAETDVIEGFVNELIEQAANESQKKPNPKSINKKSKMTDGINRNSGKLTKKIKKLNSSFDRKRISCISKTSTDSNNSAFGHSSNEGAAISDSEHESDEDIFDEKNSLIDEENNSNTTTINVEDKRRLLSLETSSINTTNNIDWELAKQTLEKGKQNVEILRQNVAMESNGKKYLKKKVTDDRKRHFNKLHPFHTHMLLYYGAYDTKQTLYAFQTLRNIISCDTRTFLCLSITTSVSSSSLKQLLIRHRKSLFGKGFTGSLTNSEFGQSYRGCMHLDVLVTICLYYARSFFHKETTDGNDVPNFEDIIGNCKVQLESIELLTLICKELIEIVRGMGKGLACYIADLMARCKMQKIILHCINSSILSFSQTNDQSLCEQILAFNNPRDEHLYAESLQIQLLRLLMAVIKLEYEVQLLKNDNETTHKSADGNWNSNSNSPTRLTPTAAINVKYLPNSLISQQPMFLAAVLSAMNADHLRHLHRNWTDLVTSSLNCFSFGSLTNIVISVVNQICNNIDKIAKLSLKQQCNFPPDYVVSQLEAITILCHYCLLENSQQTTLSHLFNQAYPQTSASAQSSNTGQLLNNIVYSFLSSQSSTESQTRSAQHLAARNAVLSHLSRIVASVAAIWDSELGQVRQVKQQLMEFLSPVSLHHGVNFLAAVAVTWQERGEQHKRRNNLERNDGKSSFSEQYQRNSMPQACPEQLSLVKLVSSIRVMPMDSFVQTLHQVVKSPPPIHRPPAGLTIEVSALELFYFYMKSASAPQLGDSWSSLLILLRDGLNLSPPAQFVLLMLLNEFVQRCPQLPFQDKKDIRDLHDITSRLIEALSNVAGACLEQTTWLRRNLAVKEDISPVTPDGSLKDLTVNQQYCIQAQAVLASVLANLLDVAYGSQEKDKVVTIVTTLMYNITPYLKNHTVRNIPSFYACSSLLASLTGYQYTRKAWRKDMFDLLLDGSFFQMDISCLPFWKQILDNLMTYDNTTFRELMSRVSLTQTGSLNIFTSREQEYEQRAVLLKRLAFIIFCSELDQYHKYMPEIQEQLANSLRLPSVVPSVQEAVFLCFRVLLLRMKPDHVTSLWPTIIAEMVQVFLAIEQELKSDSDELRNNNNSQQMRILSGMDVQWAVNAGNGMSTQNHLVHWRAVQLEAAKMLELGCVLPATNLPHFQMYRWAFVGTEFDAPEERLIANGHLDDLQIFSGSGYVPHVRRIARLMDMKYAVHSPKSEFKRGNHLVLTCQQITSIQDLYGFFSTLSVTCPTPHNFADTGKEVTSCLDEIESVLAKDFLEKIPNSSLTPR